MIIITLQIEEDPDGMAISIKAKAASATEAELAFSDCYKYVLKDVAEEIGKRSHSAILIERYPEPKKE